MDDQRLTEWLLAYQRERDASAIEALFDATAPELWRLALRLSRDAADADDLLQATYLAALESIDRFRPGRPAMGWLVAILTNKARYHRRQGGRRVDPERLTERVEHAPEQELIEKESARVLAGAVAGLPDHYRQVLQLVLGDGLRPAEIAKRLGRTPGAVRTQLHRGVDLLRGALPASMALPAVLMAFDPQRLSSLRRVVLQRAARTVPSAAAPGSGVTGSATALLAAAAVVVALGGLAAVWFSQAERAVTPHPGPVSMAAAPSRAPAESNDAPMSTPREQGRTALEEHESRPQSAPALGSGPPAEVFEFRLAAGEGYSFRRGRVVSQRRADLFLGSSSELETGPEASLSPLKRRLELDGETLSADAHLRSIDSFDPEALTWTDRTRFDVEEPPTCVVALRLERGGWAVVARVNSVWNRERGRFETVFHGAHNASSPTFHGSGAPSAFSTAASNAQGDASTGGFRLSAVASDPFQEELELRCHEALAALDRRVPRLGSLAWPSATGEPRLRGVLLRRFAAEITADGWDYQAASFSFEHDTRDDTALTRNDWSFVFEGEDGVHLRTVTDDRSEAWNLGPVAVDALPLPADLPAPVSTATELEDQDLMLIHTVDYETDRWDLLRVLELRHGRWLVFQWTPFEDPAWFAARAGHQVSSDLSIPDAGVFIQMRAGANGGNRSRVFFDGTTNHRVDELSSVPLDLAGEIDMDEYVRAHVEGGVIPQGWSWEVFQIDYGGSTRGDTNGHGGLRVVLGSEVVVDEPESEFPSSGRWTGSVSLTDASTAFVEIRNSSQCDVRVRGRWVERR